MKKLDKDQARQILSYLKEIHTNGSVYMDNSNTPRFKTTTNNGKREFRRLAPWWDGLSDCKQWLKEIVEDKSDQFNCKHIYKIDSGMEMTSQICLKCGRSEDNY